MKFTLILATVAFLAASLPVFAHHSFAAEYDIGKPVKVTGVVTRVEWLNPHIWFYIDVKGAGGKVVNWAFSGAAPGQLMRSGVTKDHIQPGMTVIVDGFRAKDGTENGFGRIVTLPDGTNVFTGNPEGAKK